MSLRGPQLPDADHLPSATLTCEQFETQFGARREDVEKAVSVFEQCGLKVEEVSPRTRSMRIGGTVASMERAFQRFLPPLLYQDGANGKPRGGSAFRDITVGRNASYPIRALDIKPAPATTR